MANTINRSEGERIPRSASGNRSGAEGIPRSASGNRSRAEGIPRSASGATWGATWDATRSAAEGGADVQITNTAVKLATVGQRLSASSPVDDARVARISRALADGSYRISAQQIATGLMQSDHALGQIGL